MTTRTKTGVLYRRRGMSGLKKAAVILGVSRVERTSDGVHRFGMQTGNKAFVACAHFKTGGYVKLSPTFEPSKMYGACAYGRNPRAAMAGALRKAAGHVSKRSGAFAGLAGLGSPKGRRHRGGKRIGRRLGR